MDISGDAQATGMTEAQATEAFERLLAGDGDKGADEPLDEADEDDESPAESEADEGEQPDEDEEGSEEDEETDEEAKEPELIAVKIDGAEVKVTLDDLKAGYSRTQDYTRKTMALAENVKAFEAEKAGLAQERETYRAVLGAWEQQLSAPLYDPAETEALRNVDPGEYAARSADEQNRQARLAALKGEQTRVSEQTATEQAQARQKALAEAEQKLIDAVPEWKDQAAFQTGLQTIMDYAASYGFAPAHLLEEPDHRTFLILKDAAAYRAIKTKSAETRAKVETVKTATPGAKATTPPKVTEVTRSKQRLAKTGRVEDAQALLERLLGG